MLTGAATVFTVRDVERSLAFFRDVIGFDITFRWGDPTFYACLCRDDVALHLIADKQAKRPAGNGAICIFVRDVDAVHAELAARGAQLPQAPQDYDYGMRDFNMVDPDGNQISFGMQSVRG